TPYHDPTLASPTEEDQPTTDRGDDMTQPAPPTLHRTNHPGLNHLLDLRPGPATTYPVAAAHDAIARGLAAAKVYAFASADFPGAAISQVFDSDDTTAVGAFIFDPTGTSRATAFTFTAGAYQTLTLPGSTASIATGITTNGLISGAYADLSGTAHGFTLTGGSFTNIDFPAATSTLAIGVNDLGQVVGSFT